MKTQVKIVIFSILTGLFFSLSSTTFAQVRMATSTTRAYATTPLYSLPFLADDLNPGERVSTGNHAAGIQGLGKDIGIQRYLGNSKWSDLKPGKDKSANENFLIYGKRIYAMAPGKIIGCWCNTEENPKPGVKHEKLVGRAGQQMPGGGNMLWVEQADGTRALYAHFRPGTIPSNLCPNKDKFFPKPLGPGEHENMYVMLPPDKQVTIKEGQYLGQSGNSGSSTGPHLHIHMEKGGQAAPMRFKNGLYLMRPNNIANINAKWSKLAGKTIPDGQILLWPVRRVTKEYARHGFPASDYQRMFDHLADSGFAPEWIDGYSVGNQIFYNFIWRKSTSAWMSYHGLSAAGYQTQVNNAKAAGYAPTFVENYKQGNGVRYNVIFKKGVAGAWVAKHGMNANTHQSTFNSLKSSGYVPVNVSVVSINGNLSYTALYRKMNVGSWMLKSQLNEAQYQNEVNANKAQGRKPVYVAAYMHNGQPHFSAIFAQQPAGSWIAKHGLTAGAYQSQFNSALGSGYLTRVVSGYDGANSNHRFVGVWRK